MKRVLLLLIRGYQRYLSPLKRTKCPYIPSCSAYGAEAVRLHGALIGSLLALWRILRCNPFSSGGFDPVPAVRKRIVYPRGGMRPGKMSAYPSDDARGPETPLLR